MKDFNLTLDVENSGVNADTLAQEIALIVKDFFVGTVVYAGDTVAIELMGKRKFTLQVNEVK